MCFYGHGMFCDCGINWFIFNLPNKLQYALDWINRDLYCLRLHREPFVFKRKGLGVIISFIAMGPLMVLGASFPFTKELSLYPIYLALPASLFIPALMISNEMRDFTRDERLSIGTLSVRIGSKYSTYLYRTLVFGAYILTVLYVIAGIYHPVSLAVFLTLPLALKANHSVTNFEKLGIPYTNSLHWKFTLILIISLFF